jgi:hypothetical protein
MAVRLQQVPVNRPVVLEDPRPPRSTAATAGPDLRVRRAVRTDDTSPQGTYVGVRELLRAHVVGDVVPRPATVEHGDLVWHEEVAVELTVIVPIPSNQRTQDEAGG